MLRSLAEILEENKVVRDVGYIHPLIAAQVLQLEKIMIGLQLKGPQLRIFETWRSPARQHYLLLKMPRVTEVQPWQSAHQYGLAVDFAGYTRGGDWTWDVPSSTWRALRAQADKVGLVVPAPSWDPGHVEYVAWADLRDVFV